MPIPLTRNCELIIDGRKVHGSACLVDVGERKQPQVYGFLTASYEILKNAQMAGRVELEFDGGRRNQISLLQVNPGGIALIAIKPRPV